MIQSSCLALLNVNYIDPVQNKLFYFISNFVKLYEGTIYDSDVEDAFTFRIIPVVDPGVALVVCSMTPPQLFPRWTSGQDPGNPDRLYRFVALCFFVLFFCIFISPLV